MADAEKKTNLVCFAGEDPNNPRTKGAYATIFDADTGKSVYHLSRKEVELGPLDRALEKYMGDYKADKSGSIRFSQPEGTPNHNPLRLNPAINGITIEFKGGKPSECRVDTGHDVSTPSLIPIVDKIPTPPAAAPKPGASTPKVAEASYTPTVG